MSIMADIYRSSLKTLTDVLIHFPNPSAIFIKEADSLFLLATSNLEEKIDNQDIPEKIVIDQKQLNPDKIKAGKIFNVNDKVSFAPELFEFSSVLKFKKVSFLKVLHGEELYGLVVVGGRGAISLTKKALIPYTNAVQLIQTIFDQADHLKNYETPSQAGEPSPPISQEIAASGDLGKIFSILHEKIKQSIGDFSTFIALYDEDANSIRIPYDSTSEGIDSIESFPEGEGLTSILIRTKQPLMLLENVSEQAEALGAKIQGKPAKSWLGVPLLVKNEPIGAIVIQDFENENAFTDSDLQFLSDLAQQATGFIFSAGVTNDLRQRHFQLQAVAEVARNITSALNLDELLKRAINLLQERFNYYHTSIFMIDLFEQNVVVREASGDAGAQMKRTGHKLAIGSKSVVGFAAGQGETLVINDTANDATYLPNPLLPDTRAEAAIPLKVGEQILGVLDVQSKSAFSFTPSDIEIFEILADQLAIAVNNAELFAESQEHLSQHRLLHHIITSAASGSTLNEALTSAVEGLQVTLGGDRVSILISDPKRNNLSIAASVGYSGAADTLIVPFGSGITGWVAAHRKSLRINDVEQEARYIQVSSNTRSELALPLIFRNDVLGVLNVESEQVGAYTENDEEMLGTLAGSLAAIITNARLVDQIRRHADRERQLYEITSKIRRSSDMQTILTTTINELSYATGARKAQISVGIPEGGTAPLLNTAPLPDKDAPTMKDK